jgi:hypothetical protein
MAREVRQARCGVTDVVTSGGGNMTSVDEGDDPKLWFGRENRLFSQLGQYQSAAAGFE